MVVAGATTTEQLHRPVGNLLRHARTGDLDHCYFTAGIFVAYRVHLVGGIHRQKAGLLDHDTGFGDALKCDRLIGQWAPERSADFGPPTHALKYPLRKADQPHTMVDPSRTKPSLCYFKTPAFAEKHVRDRHSHVLEDSLRRAIRHAIETHYWQCTDNPDAWCLAWDQYHRLAPIGIVGFRPDPAHEDEDLAGGIRGVGRVPLAAIYNVFVTLADDRTGDHGRIGRGHRRFGHCEGRANFAGQQRIQPLFLLLSRTIAQQCFHVAGVG